MEARVANASPTEETVAIESEIKKAVDELETLPSKRNPFVDMVLWAGLGFLAWGYIASGRLHNLLKLLGF
jgi:hypothetical protein